MPEVVDPHVVGHAAGLDGGSRTRVRKVLREIGVPAAVANCISRRPGDYSDHRSRGTHAAAPPRTILRMVDAARVNELSSESPQAFLRRAAVVGVVLVIIVSAGIYLTSRTDERTAQDRCRSAVRTQPGITPGAAVAVTSTDRIGDDYLVRGTVDRRAYTCLVTRGPFDGGWEVADVRF
jgi:hypothetical protein